MGWTLNGTSKAFSIITDTDSGHKRWSTAREWDEREFLSRSVQSRSLIGHWELKNLAMLTAALQVVTESGGWGEEEANTIDTFVDSDWTECRSSRRSPLGGMVMVGTHTTPHLFFYSADARIVTSRDKKKEEEQKGKEKRTLYPYRYPCPCPPPHITSHITILLFLLLLPLLYLVFYFVPLFLSLFPFLSQSFVSVCFCVSVCVLVLSDSFCSCLLDVVGALEGSCLCVGVCLFVYSFFCLSGWLAGWLAGWLSGWLSVCLSLSLCQNAHRLDTVTLLHICFPYHRVVVCTWSLFQRIRDGGSCAAKQTSI